MAGFKAIVVMMWWNNLSSDIKQKKCNKAFSDKDEIIAHDGYPRCWETLTSFEIESLYDVAYQKFYKNIDFLVWEFCQLILCNNHITIQKIIQWKRPMFKHYLLLVGLPEYERMISVCKDFHKTLNTGSQDTNKQWETFVSDMQCSLSDEYLHQRFNLVHVRKNKPIYTLFN